jgi:hypothetical protein
MHSSSFFLLSGRSGIPAYLPLPPSSSGAATGPGSSEAEFSLIFLNSGSCFVSSQGQGYEPPHTPEVTPGSQIFCLRSFSGGVLNVLERFYCCVFTNKDTKSHQNEVAHSGPDCLDGTTGRTLQADFQETQVSMVAWLPTLLPAPTPDERKALCRPLLQPLLGRRITRCPLQNVTVPA